MVLKSAFPSQPSSLKASSNSATWKPWILGLTGSSVTLAHNEAIHHPIQQIIAHSNDELARRGGSLERGGRYGQKRNSRRGCFHTRTDSRDAACLFRPSITLRAICHQC